MLKKIPKKLAKIFGDNKKFIEHPDAIKGSRDAPEMGFKKAMREGTFMGMTPDDQNSMIKKRIRMIMQMGSLMRRMMKEQKKVSATLDENPKNSLNKIDEQTIKELEHFAKKLNVKIGFTKLDQKFVFKNEAVLYENVIVLSMEMDRGKMNLAPSSETQKMIMKTYHELGVVANKITAFLRKKGFSAHAGHPLGGSVSYPPLAEFAGMGYHGRHGLIITPDFGPCHRLAAVFTNIKNLPFKNENKHTWIAEYCKKCGRCIEKCPVGAIHENPIENDIGTITHIDSTKCFPYFGNNYGCSVCIKECMFHRVGYEKLYHNYKKKKK